MLPSNPYALKMLLSLSASIVPSTVPALLSIDTVEISMSLTHSISKVMAGEIKLSMGQAANEIGNIGDIFHGSSNVMHQLQQVTFEDWAWVGVALHLLVTIFIVLRILATQRNTSVAIAWLVLLFAIPVIGIVAYMLVGEPYLGRRYNRRNRQAQEMLEKAAQQEKLEFGKIEDGLPMHYQGVSRIGVLDTGFGVYNNHRMQLLTDANHTFDTLIKDINAAKTQILMEFYIIFPKGRVLGVFDALIAAANRGVECQILADSVGSFTFFTDDLIDRLSQAGVVVHRSLPVGLFKTLFKRSDLRNHRKIVVIDRHIGYTGSFNLVDPHLFKKESGVGQWIDVIMRIESEEAISIVTALALVNTIDISAESQRNLNELGYRIDERVNEYTRKLYYPSPTINDVNDKVPSTLAEHIFKRHMNEAYGQPRQLIVDKGDEEKVSLAMSTGNQGTIVDSMGLDGMGENILAMPDFPTINNIVAQLIPSAPHITGHVIYNTLLTVLHRADHRIQITTPYFVPDEALLSALTTAAKRGVAVTLIMPKKVDSFLVQHASQSSYADLLDAGVKLALFNGGLLHAKTVVIDDDYCLFGTVNMDMRSFYLNMEVSLALYTPEMVAQVLTCQQAYLTQCEWVDASQWQARPNFQRLFDSLIRLFSPLL